MALSPLVVLALLEGGFTTVVVVVVVVVVPTSSSFLDLSSYVEEPDPDPWDPISN